MNVDNYRLVAILMYDGDFNDKNSSLQTKGSGSWTNFRLLNSSYFFKGRKYRACLFDSGSKDVLCLCEKTPTRSLKIHTKKGGRVIQAILEADENAIITE